MSELNLEEIESRANATPTKEQLAEMFRNFSEYPNQDAEMYSAMLRSRTASAEQVKDLIAEVRRLRESLELHEQGLLKELAQASVFTAQAIGSVPAIVAQKMLTIGYSGLVAQRGELKAQIERVRGLHKPEHLHDTPLCVECSDFGADDHPAGALIEYPCPTIKALDAPKGICDHGCESLTGLCIVDHKSLGGGDGE